VGGGYSVVALDLATARAVEVTRRRQHRHPWLVTILTMLAIQKKTILTILVMQKKWE